jgi:hypothetical protein
MMVVAQLVVSSHLLDRQKVMHQTKTTILVFQVGGCVGVLVMFPLINSEY